MLRSGTACHFSSGSYASGCSQIWMTFKAYIRFYELYYLKLFHTMNRMWPGNNRFSRRRIQDYNVTKLQQRWSLPNRQRVCLVGEGMYFMEIYVWKYFFWNYSLRIWPFQQPVKRLQIKVFHPSIPTLVSYSVNNIYIDCPGINWYILYVEKQSNLFRNK